MTMVEVPSFLTERQADLVRETEPARIEELDEDALLELHQRVRRARNKYVKLYRRQGAALVPERGSRAMARPANKTSAGKAEVFELALARVSARIDVVARAAAQELREVRLAAASPDPYPSDAPGAQAAAPVESSRRRATKTTGGVKRDASTRSSGARRQARKDSR